MKAARSNVVHRAVALIDPAPELRASCVNSVHLALFEMVASDDDLWRMYHHRTKAAKRSLDRLYSDIRRLQINNFDDQNLEWRYLSIFPTLEKDIFGLVDPIFLGGSTAHDFAAKRAETDRWLTMWLKRVDAARQTKRGPPGRVRLEAEKKLIAAREAKSLLQQFKKKISATKGSAFCQLTALLYGGREADVRYACRKVVPISVL